MKTGGYLLDVALARAIDNGWIDGPRLVPAGHAITPTGGHLDPTMFQRLGPGIMPLSVEEGIANGVPEVRKAVRYQIKYGARLIKISASGGVMSHSGLAGAQQYSDEELAAIVDEAHRAGLKVAAHAHGDAGIRACIRAGVDCIEHGSLASDETIQMMVEHGTFLVPTSYLSEGLDVSRAAPELQAKAAEVFPRARAMLGKAIAAGVKIACGTDAPAIPHGENAKELWAMVDRGMTPMQALQAATVMSAELIDVDDRGRLAPGLLADIIAVPGDPSEDITMTQDVRFVMKGGRVYKGASESASIEAGATTLAQSTSSGIRLTSSCAAAGSERGERRTHLGRRTRALHLGEPLELAGAALLVQLVALDLGRLLVGLRTCSRPTIVPLARRRSPAGRGTPPRRSAAAGSPPRRPCTMPPRRSRSSMISTTRASISSVSAST